MDITLLSTNYMISSLPSELKMVWSHSAQSTPITAYSPTPSTPSWRCWNLNSTRGAFWLLSFWLSLHCDMVKKWTARVQFLDGTAILTPDSDQF